MADPYSLLAVKIMNPNLRAYEALVVEGGTPPLARELLEDVQPDQLLAAPAKSPVYAYAMLAGLWLWHDGLTECHEIVQRSPEDPLFAARNSHSTTSKTSQKVPDVQSLGNDKLHQNLQDIGSTLAFWHAIMHRREGDFSNAKYWYARCRRHPAQRSIAASMAALAQSTGVDPLGKRLVAVQWDGPELVDLVESVYRRPIDTKTQLAQRLQQIEWQGLFEYCGVKAAGQERRSVVA